MHENDFNIRIESSLFYNISSNTDGGGLSITKKSFKVLIFSSCFNKCSSSNFGGGVFVNTTYTKCSHSVFFNNIALSFTAIGIISDNSTSSLLSISKNSIKSDSLLSHGWTYGLTCQEAHSQYMNSSYNIANHICSYYSYYSGNTYYRFVQAYNDASVLHHVMIQAAYGGRAEYFYSNFLNCTLKGDYKHPNIRAAEGSTMLLEYCYGKNIKSDANSFSSDVTVRNSCFDSYTGNANIDSTSYCTMYNNFTFVPFEISADECYKLFSNEIKYISDYKTLMQSAIIYATPN
ncbi:hypothetical protein TVAG_399310 [Trichomonas vaginalis G3]|uniref:Uncharacterized protein n=1 Tax=Trichomonas vaginalis (strain ATCC PRA-98 / G3) TaxID=412133 RepID=A2E5W9_TRIV3|nr:hypothetical protein TVAGG3_0337770 [Trichomonas vaginalis G3]EAY11926.1 hypothetical protein TVAG_399310 [Trichomonas vaginalis G3]KAI5530409.1 hypothetical protein TVAGG3_0337770 [Trichomonas vaginalis G3]|eukprot:XP_001324149.1 hypothetical protein [Trichomonas vaginalis G3]